MIRKWWGSLSIIIKSGIIGSAVGLILGIITAMGLIFRFFPEQLKLLGLYSYGLAFSLGKFCDIYCPDFLYNWLYISLYLIIYALIFFIFGLLIGLAIISIKSFRKI